MRPLPKHALVSIAEEDRQKLFEKMIVRDDGTIVTLITAIKAEANTEDWYGQAVSVGTVLSVGQDTDLVREGDLVVLDYTVDLTDEIRVMMMEGNKLVSVNTETRYCRKDIILDANRKTPHPSIVQRKGDLERGTMIIAVFRDEELLPLPPYILLHKSAHTGEYISKDGSSILTLDVEGEGIVRRTILAVNGHSSLSVGQDVYCESEALFERQLNDLIFDVILESDIIATIV